MASSAWRGKKAHPRHGVGEVEPCRPDRYPDLTRSHCRLGPFLDLQYLRTSGPGQDDRLHDPKLTRLPHLSPPRSRS